MIRNRIALCALFLSAACCFLPRAARAQAFASSILQFSNVTITPDSGTVQFLGPPWTANAFAQAQNSLGGSDSNSASSLGGAANASAAVTYASANGNANAATLAGTGISTVNITVPFVQASSVGRGSLTNSFVVNGGTGTVNVTFDVDISGTLGVFTGVFGEMADTETIFSWDLVGPGIPTPILFRQDFLHIDGPNQTASTSFTTHLSTVIALDFGTTYEATITADSESLGITSVPEVSPAFACLIGMVVMAGLLRRSIRVRA